MVADGAGIGSTSPVRLLAGLAMDQYLAWQVMVRMPLLMEPPKGRAFGRRTLSDYGQAALQGAKEGAIVGGGLAVVEDCSVLVLDLLAIS